MEIQRYENAARRCEIGQRFKLLPWVLLLILPGYVPSAWSGAGENANTITLPYVAVGGAPEGWHLLTLLFLTNASNDSDSGTVEFFDNDGQPLSIALNGDSELKTDASWDVPAGASKLLVLTHPDNVFRAGWLQVNLSQKSELRVTIVARFYNSHSLIAEARIQASPHRAFSSSYYLTASPGKNLPLAMKEASDVENRQAPCKGKA